MKKYQTSDQDESATLLSNNFLNFLASRPLISIRGLEKAVNMPNDTIRKAKEGGRRIPEKYFYALALALRDYGFDWPQIKDSEIVGYEPISDDHRFL